MRTAERSSGELEEDERMRGGLWRGREVVGAALNSAALGELDSSGLARHN